MGYITNWEEIAQANGWLEDDPAENPSQNPEDTVNQKSGGKNKARLEVPIWHKVNLTLEETAAYSGIGINKLREITDKKDCGFVLFIGRKRLIKRRQFEEYLAKHCVI